MLIFIIKQFQIEWLFNKKVKSKISIFDLIENISNIRKRVLTKNYRYVSHSNKNRFEFEV